MATVGAAAVGPLGLGLGLALVACDSGTSESGPQDAGALSQASPDASGDAASGSPVEDGGAENDAGQGSDASAAADGGYDHSPTIPNPPTSATVYANLDDLSAWSSSTGAASSCPDGKASSTCNPPNANSNSAVLHVADPGSAPPGSDNDAGLFELLDSPAWATCIWGHSIGTSTTVRHFIWDFQVYVTATNYQSSELDFYQILSGKRFMLGTQCDRAANSWDTWNEGSQHWVQNPSIPCATILTPSTWHHVVMYLSTDSSSQMYTYHTLRVDEVDYPLEQAEPVEATTWPDGLIGVQVQLDANASGKGVNEYVEAMKVYAW